jgi:hypothetical protein
VERGVPREPFRALALRLFPLSPAFVMDVFFDYLVCITYKQTLSKLAFAPGSAVIDRGHRVRFGPEADIVKTRNLMLSEIPSDGSPLSPKRDRLQARL